MERGEAFSKTWRTTHGDLSAEEWELIGDLVAPYSGEGRIGRPIRNDRHDLRQKPAARDGGQNRIQITAAP